jgi:hypothetical protein
VGVFYVLSAWLAKAGRKKVEALYGSEAKERLIEFYT